MQNKEKHDFEKEMMRDTFEQEAFDGLSKLSKEDLLSDISELKSAIESRTKKSKTIVPVWFKYAAGVVILIGVGLSVLLFNNTFWQDSIIKEQISEEMEVADSMINSAEKEIKQIAGVTDTVAKQDFVADNRQKEDQKDKLQEPIPEVNVLNEMVLEFEDEAVSDVQFELAELDLEEDSYDEVDATTNSSEEKLEAKTPDRIVKDNNEPQVMKAEQAVQGKVAGSQVEKSAKREHSKKSKESPAMAQTVGVEQRTITVKGKVVGAEDGLSIPGVSIVVKDNPNIGVTTNIDGEFELTVPSDEELKTLIASFVGMEQKEFTLDGDSGILVYLEPDVLEMEEVVVTAFGVKREKRKVAYATKTKSSNSSEVRLVGDIKLKNIDRYIEDNFGYERFKEYPGRYIIKVSFMVDEKGNLNDFAFDNSPNKIINNEIIYLIEESGTWIPAVVNGENVTDTVKFNIRLNIK